MPVDHYENFPVASYALPARYRRPVALIYRFAREADDIADEGDAPAVARLEELARYRGALDDIETGRPPRIPWFTELDAVVRAHDLPLALFRDLLSAFEQDVRRARYATFDEVLDYCRRSANPVGRLLLTLYRADTPENRSHADAICTALQLINFLQDVAIDWQKGRVYLSEDELADAGFTASDIGRAPRDDAWAQFMRNQAARARALLLSGAPIGRALRGRLGLEMRMIIAGGARILQKIDAAHGDVFRRRPVLKWRDWAVIASRALRR